MGISLKRSRDEFDPDAAVAHASHNKPYLAYTGPAQFRGIPGRDIRPRPKNLIRYLLDQFLLPVFLCFLFTVQSMVGFFYTRQVDQSRLLTDTSLALMAWLFLVSQTVRAMPRLRVLLEEHREHQSLADLLEDAVQPKGRVFQNISGNGFEIDYVLVLPAGIFALSVEALHQPSGQEASALFDGEFLHVEGAFAVREPVARSKVVARCLAELLDDRVGFGYKVRPVLLVPAWTIHRPRPPGSESWASSPHDFIAILHKLPTVLDDTELREIQSSMSEIMRDAKRRSEHLKRSGQLR